MRFGIDLGGTKIAGLALADDGTEAATVRVATPPDYRAALDTIAEVVDRLAQATGQRGTVGVDIPGAIEAATGRVKNANATWLIGHRLTDDLAERLGQPVRVTNDANAFALSEASDGAAAGADVVFGVILGTGVGGGIVVNGRVVEGANRIGGEWGHTPLPWPKAGERPGPDCYCGRTGCAETFLSGPGLARDHARETGQTLTTHQIADRAQAGDPGAVATLDRYVDRLARGLGQIATVLDPNVFVLGGGLSNLPRLAERVEAAMPPHVFSDRVVTRVVRNLHGDASGVRGAAWLWEQA
ncbi:ROK family protein [Rubrivirga sp. IMCC45206]|uniref:ROK family protein n=1 Tax=Rubrivirga sp. IMCC45206 TaxID=3391614 RepID=UPI00398FB2FC